MTIKCAMRVPFSSNDSIIPGHNFKWKGQVATAQLTGGSCNRIRRTGAVEKCGCFFRWQVSAVSLF